MPPKKARTATHDKEKVVTQHTHRYGLRSKSREEALYTRLPQNMTAPINQLPMEMLLTILSFVNVRDLTRNCLLVSLQFEAAARADLRTRKHLSIINDLSDFWCPWKGKEEEYFRMEKFDHKSMRSTADGLKVLMPGLQYLHIVPHTKVFHTWIQGLAPILVELDARGIELPIKKGISFPSLTRLRCRGVYEQTFAVCPNLRSIGNIYCSVKEIPQTITELEIRLSSRDSPAIESLTGLQHLTHLKACIHCFSETSESVILPLFRSFRKLVSFHLSLEYPKYHQFSATDVDDAVQVLVRRNPGLEKMAMHAFLLTDQALMSVSRLRNLKVFELTKSGKRVTSSGIVSLFRGPSARLLEHVVICKPGLQISASHEQEIRSIASQPFLQFNDGFGMSTSSNRLHVPQPQLFC